MAKLAIHHLRLGMAGLIIGTTLMAFLSWLVFPWWGAAAVTALHATSVGLLFKVWGVLEAMIEDTEDFMIRAEALCNQVQDEISRSGLIN